jgi:predicted metal-dependent enzyme (double-stranded beta helix superfamily)
MFDLDDFLDRCQHAAGEAEPRRAVREVLERAMATPDEVAAALSPSEGGLTVLHRSAALTVMHVVWAPRMALYPHDHLMWAAIGIYAGQEDNAFYRRTAPGQGVLVESGGRQLRAGDTALLGDDAIHAVTNPGDRLTGAIHAYGGDFVDQPRSQWGPGPREERPYEYAVLQEQFATANDAWRRGGT